jgi:hypothetical protein
VFVLFCVFVDLMLSCLHGYTGATAGLKDSACSGLCQAGYHCDAASISPTQLECAVLRRTGTFDGSIGAKAKLFVTTVRLRKRSSV